MKSHTILLLAILLSGPLATAEELPSAKQPDERTVSNEKLLETYDADKDGKLGKDEIAKIGRDRLMQNDLNHDNHLDEAELKIMRGKSHQMPQQDALSRAMAREKALNDERVEKVRVIERANQPAKDK